MLFTFRCMSCSSIGLYTTFVSPFLAEIAPDNKKYFFGFINQIANAIGFLTVTIIGAQLNNFRKVAFICSVPNIVLCIGILFIPEKPQSTQRATVCATCKYHKELFIAFLFMFFLQFSGIQPVMSNLGEILNRANLGDKGHKMGIYATATQLVTTLIFAFIVDKVGNFIMWEISAAGEMIAFVLMCCHQKLNLPTWVFLLGLFLHMLSYGMGNGPIPFARATVLLEPQFRSTAMAIIVAINWALTAGINAIWPTLQEKMSLGFAFLFFACIMVLSLIFGFIVVRNLDLRDKAVLDNESEEESKKEGKMDDVSSDDPL
ncbi:major facilitator superfamily protein [Trichomonas vaginalis G3]|uniref:Major facilitator superfamily protein n=1 Tax=Trichomonas vaginalis (strain ATCC PRA-98 / G3) TaxID=412133 RepID=A2EFT1_TRIV3|nr:major facilitator superfamily transporter [Trichomonas vaginalis G3]EAY08482.1 major facilitator superfamily protein [Trichomonas vaginalis G3]KAI5537761.1 glucose import [Trichomonas vaginalis G3]|eukprot:XP_001320705.1 major facilitator superfamily transporter [Trichomonas vaginalis G3]